MATKTARTPLHQHDHRLERKQIGGGLEPIWGKSLLLPLEHWVNLSAYKESLGGRVAEVSMPGFST